MFLQGLVEMHDQYLTTMWRRARHAFEERHRQLRQGERIEGVYRRSLELAGGRFAVIEKSREFTLVPWRPVLERNLDMQVSGIMRGDTISWTIGRHRSGPSIS
jgi:hypothetical protein